MSHVVGISVYSSQNTSGISVNPPQSAPDSQALMCLKQNAILLFFSGISFMICWTGILVYLTIRENEPVHWFLLSFLIKNMILLPVQFFLGYGVLHWQWIVGYTRKVIHVGFFLLPFLLDICLPLPEKSQWVWALWNGNLICWMLVGMTKPVRKKLGFARLMYAAVDRPEDRGLTQVYTLVQVPLSLIIIVGFTILLDIVDRQYWTLCPIIAVTFGDGLAEPVAVYWKRNKICGGTHTYRTRGLCSGSRRFERSIEGSTTVFLFTGLAVGVIANDMSIKECGILLGILPLTMTLLEMIAPHSMDNPFLLFWGYVVLFFVYFV